MPELPEVETVVRDLRPLLVGRVLGKLQRSKHKLRTHWLPRWEPLLLGRTVARIDRRGKWIVIVLDDDTRLLVHLGMTGQLRVIETTQPAADHTHLTFALDIESVELRYRDIRRFGTALVLTASAETDQFFENNGLGPEPFDIDPAYWRATLADTNRCLKAVLLDQRVVAGVGNIYADESLFEAKLPPWRLASTLTPKEADRLRMAVTKVLERAIETRGSTIRNYVGGSGLKGGYQEEFRAYGRTGKPCRRCKSPIERIRLAGRSTHFCPLCQADNSKLVRKSSPPSR
ncbi:bifunctional DNA-formamidopyrimidine glycosylase/DNA-(apurinic or apyrimidinic site) lyase [soil metagenome]